MPLGDMVGSDVYRDRPVDRLQSQIGGIEIRRNQHHRNHAKQRNQKQ
jgi:hypothetical protein